MQDSGGPANHLPEAKTSNYQPEGVWTSVADIAETLLHHSRMRMNTDGSQRIIVPPIPIPVEKAPEDVFASFCDRDTNDIGVVRGRGQMMAKLLREQLIHRDLRSVEHLGFGYGDSAIEQLIASSSDQFSDALEAYPEEPSFGKKPSLTSISLTSENIKSRNFTPSSPLPYNVQEELQFGGSPQEASGSSDIYKRPPSPDLATLYTIDDSIFVKVEAPSPVIEPAATSPPSSCSSPLPHHITVELPSLSTTIMQDSGGRANHLPDAKTSNYQPEGVWTSVADIAETLLHHSRMRMNTDGSQRIIVPPIPFPAEKAPEDVFASFCDRGTNDIGVVRGRGQMMAKLLREQLIHRDLRSVEHLGFGYGDSAIEQLIASSSDQFSDALEAYPEEPYFGKKPSLTSISLTSENIKSRNFTPSSPLPYNVQEELQFGGSPQEASGSSDIYKRPPSPDLATLYTIDDSIFVKVEAPSPVIEPAATSPPSSCSSPLPHHITVETVGKE